MKSNSLNHKIQSFLLHVQNNNMLEVIEEILLNESNNNNNLKKFG